MSEELRTVAKWALMLDMMNEMKQLKIIVKERGKKFLDMAV